MSNQTFDFSEALRRMERGKKVRRRVWSNDLYAYIKDNILMYQAPTDYGIIAIPYSDFDGKVDKSATDWEEVK